MSAASKQKNFKSNGKGAETSFGAQVSMLATLMISVIASRYVDYDLAAVSWSRFTNWHYLLFALIVSFMGFRIADKKMQQSPSAKSNCKAAFGGTVFRLCTRHYLPCARINLDLEHQVLEHSSVRPARNVVIPD
jgi:hypothetical protein